MDLIKYSDNFDECLKKAVNFYNSNNHLFIHPYDDYDIIEGQIETLGFKLIKK